MVGATVDGPGQVDVPAVVRRLAKTAAALAPATASSPGSRPEHVWYVSYGSNLLRRRLERYLLGGRLPGLDVDYPGGDDVAPPAADRPVVLPGSLRFALDAPAWGGGGVCFWVEDAAGAGVLARAWRLRLQQYLEVVHLENGGRERVAAAWRHEVLTDGAVELHDGWYGRLVLAGLLDGEPALTFTAPRASLLEPRPPSRAYADVVLAGLLETFGDARAGGLTEHEARAYLAAAARRG